jgi:hypothetical protein
MTRLGSPRLPPVQRAFVFVVTAAIGLIALLGIGLGMLVLAA